MRFFLLPVLTGLLLLAGCGQKGPLYIPQEGSKPAANVVAALAKSSQQ